MKAEKRANGTVVLTMTAAEAEDFFRKLTPVVDTPGAIQQAHTALGELFSPVPRAEAAALIRNASKAMMRRVRETKYPDLAALICDDAEKLKHLAHAVLHGKDHEASLLVSRMDTACREEIPEEAWVYCGLVPIR